MQFLSTRRTGRGFFAAALISGALASSTVVAASPNDPQDPSKGKPQNIEGSPSAKPGTMGLLASMKTPPSAAPLQYRFNPSTKRAMEVLGAKGTVVYLGQFDGIDGFLFSGTTEGAEGQEIMYKTIYVSPGGDYLIDGYMIDADNRNISQLQLAAMAGGRLVSDKDTVNGKEHITQSILETEVYFDLGSLDDLRTIAFIYALPGAEKNRFNTVYLTPGGKSVIVGTAYDLSGVNVTQQQVSKLIAGSMFGAGASSRDENVNANSADTAKASVLSAPSSGSAASSAVEESATPQATQKAAAVEPVTKANQKKDMTAGEKVDALSKIAHFSVGAAGPDVPEVNIIVDPKCPHCHKFWDDVRLFVAEGMLRLNVSMAAYKSDESVLLSLAILSSDDPAETFTQVMNNQYKLDQSPQVLPEARQKILATHAVMEDTDLVVSPVISFVDRSGQRNLLVGAPTDTTEFLMQIFEPSSFVRKLREIQSRIDTQP